jgi:dipeptidyl-peptidase-3
MKRLAPLVALALGCASAPPIEPAPPEPPPTAQVAAPAPSATPGAAADAPRSLVLGMVGDTTVASYPPTGFDELTASDRALAYHLAQASLAGDPIYVMQSSRWSWPITQAVMRILAQGEKIEQGGKIDPALREKLVEYRRRLYLHHGVHDAQTGQKFLPPFAQKDFEAAARAAGVKAPKEMLAEMFDPKVAPTRTNKTPGKDKDPIVESAANHYEGVTSKDLKAFKDTYPLNGRVVKERGKLVEQVYRAGGDGAPPGLGAAELGRVVRHLEAAIPLSPPAEQESLKLLIRYLRTGESDAFRKHDIAWLKQSFPVDYILGFIETYTDVRARKGGFEAFVAIRDPERDPPLQALAKNALHFEQKMPWKDAWKREAFQVPAAAAVNVLAANGDGGPFTFGGVNLPNPQDLREKYGTKNFIVLSSLDTRAELSGQKIVDEFAPEEARAEIHRCRRHLTYAAVSFHEVTGHGSGKVNPGLGDPAEILAPYYATMEEGRADLVADWLTGDPRTVEIGLLPDAGCARIFPQSKMMSALTFLAAAPHGDVAEEDHLRASLIAFGYLRDKGAVTVEERGGKTFFVVKDPDAWRRAAGELLAEHQRIKATGDKEALRALVEKYGIRLNTKWRDEVLQRLRALSLPRSVAKIPPMLTPVRDASGKVVDAKAEQTRSLDEYIAAMEKTWID